MVRRIGFDKPGGGGVKKSVAESYLDEFRARSRRQQQVAAKNDSIRTERQWFPIIFLTVWLTGWTGGMYLAAASVLNGGSEPFLWVWLLIASIGWVFAVYALIRLLRGTAVKRK